MNNFHHVITEDYEGKISYEEFMNNEEEEEEEVISKQIFEGWIYDV